MIGLKLLKENSMLGPSLNPRTKGLRIRDWAGYQSTLTMILRRDRTIKIEELEAVCAEYKVPFFKEMSRHMILELNDLENPLTL